MLTLENNQQKTFKKQQEKNKNKRFETNLKFEEICTFGRIGLMLL